MTYEGGGEMDRSEAVLLGLLYALGREAYRTKLVKLTYMLDEASYRLRGQTMTGFEYEWSHYGPNAADNAIVRRLNECAESGALAMNERKTPYGNPAYGYRISPDCNPSGLPLSSDDWIEIQTAVHNYGNMNRDQIVREAKSTAPFRTARQYQRLEFTQDPPLTPEEVSADPFWQETLASMRSTSPRISIDQLREEVAQPSDH